MKEKSSIKSPVTLNIDIRLPASGDRIYPESVSELKRFAISEMIFYFKKIYDILQRNGRHSRLAGFYRLL